MVIRNGAVLAKAARKNVPLRLAREAWLQVTAAAAWNNFQDARRTFPSADGVTVKVGSGVKVVVTVFNIKGNEYRLISIVNYEAATVFLCDVLTHSEYSKGKWKGRL
jgi:mRNA interferase HigB